MTRALCMKIASGIAVTAFCLTLGGCFTGIDSTPKITAADVKKQQVTETPEERFLSSVAHQRFDEWQSGKLLYVTDDKISVALEPGAAAYPRAGELIEFHDSRSVTSMTGKPDTELIFLTQGGNEVRYRLSASADELQKRSKIDVPFTIELSVVDDIRKAILGETYYIRTATWFDDNGTAIRGRKFIPVKIIDVTPGNTVYPVKLTFRTLDGTDQKASLYMSAADSVHRSRDFASLFYFNDPRKRYPAITDENWALIVNGHVARYMTRDECRLALGAPTSIDRRPGISTMREVWTYDNGIYLLFDDGILQSFRN